MVTASILIGTNASPPTSITFSPQVYKCVALGTDSSANTVIQVEMPEQSWFFLWTGSVPTGNQVAYAVLRPADGNGAPEAQICSMTAPANC